MSKNRLVFVYWVDKINIKHPKVNYDILKCTIIKIDQSIQIFPFAPFELHFTSHRSTLTADVIIKNNAVN